MMTDLDDDREVVVNLDDFAFAGSLDSWLEVLPLYQKQLLQELVARGRAEAEVAEAWLDAASKRSDTAPFGGQRLPSLFYQKFLDELHNLFCSNDRIHKAERQRVVKQLGIGRTAVVAETSSLLAQHLGASESFLAPAVAVSLSLIGQVGLRAWCAAQTERRSTANSQSQ